MRTFPIFAFPVLGVEGEIPDAESHTSSAMRGTGHSPAQTQLLCVGKVFLTQLLLSKRLGQGCFLLDLENSSGGAGEELPLAAPEHLCTQILLPLKLLLIHTEMKNRASVFIGHGGEADLGMEIVSGTVLLTGGLLGVSG